MYQILEYVNGVTFYDGFYFFFSLTYKEIEGMETFASSSDSEDDEPCDPGETENYQIVKLFSMSLLFCVGLFVV